MASRNLGIGRTRRSVIGALGAATGTALLAACGAQGGAGQETAGKEHAPVKLTTNIQSPASTQWGAYDAANKAIQAKYPWLTMEYLGGSSSSFEGMTKLVVDAAAGNLPDMYYAQGTQIQYFINQKIAAPMSPYIAKDKSFDINDFPKVALDMYSRSGTVYGIPYDHGPNMLWYNADLFQKMGVKPPDDKTTFDDLVEMSKRLTNEAQGTWGIANNGPTASWSMPSYVGPWGAEWVDATETKTTINSAAGVQAMQYWYDLFFKHKVNPVPPTTPSQTDMYIQGKVGMIIGGPWTYRDLIGKITFQSPIANWPLQNGKRISASMGSGYPISAMSKFKDETWLYESELLGKDPDRSILHQFLKTGYGLPVRFSTMKEYDKTKFAPPNASIVAPAEKYSVLGRPISPAKVELDKVWTEERARLLKQEIGVKEMLDTVAKRIQPLLDANKGWDAVK
jgi:multiple sugar transport system substrate-binding protein